MGARSQCWLLGALLATACGIGEPPPRPADTDIAPLRQEATALRAEIAVLEGENRRLREALLGRESWSLATSFDPEGGAGGRQYRRMCQRGQALSAFRGTHGAAVDSLIAVCSPLDQPASDESAATRIETELDPIGGRGGEPFDRACPGGAFVTELRGRADDTLVRLQGICGSVDEGEEGDDPGAAIDRAPRENRRRRGTNLSRIGGAGGSSFTHTCPEGQVGVGISGHSGDVVDSLALHCAVPLDTLGP